MYQTPQARTWNPGHGEAKGSLEARFDRIFSRSFGFDDLDQALLRLKARKSALLVVLDRPEVPLNTNISEQEIRDQP